MPLEIWKLDCAKLYRADAVHHCGRHLPFGDLLRRVGRACDRLHA
jgi:hypothetical protein